MTSPYTHPPRVVIIGAGFGGLYAARALKRAPVDVTVIDRTNHHVFQPLLYQVATATLPATAITAPIRWLLRKQRNTRVLMAEVKDIDVDRRVVRIDDERRDVPYDYLIVAAGSRHAYFGHPEWEEYAPGLKSIDDALEIRRRLLLAFERAEKTEDPRERGALLTFVIVGGGPTGVELAGMLPMIARYSLPKEFRNIDTRAARIILVEGGPRVLPTFPENLAARAGRDLQELGVEVRTGVLVTSVEPGAVHIGDERVETCTVLWAAGNAASGLGTFLGVELDRAGRIKVEPDLSLPGRPEVFVIGDLAAITTGGRPVPGVAPAAMQEGATAAKNIIRSLRRQPRRHFRYRNKGDLATIGRQRAIADFGRFHVEGAIAWWFWLFVHIMYLAGFRNRMAVLLEWAYAFFTYQRGSRLITAPRYLSGPAPSAAPPIPPKW
ncbi:MAG: NAD(P)/FAD-dependent oxidoreductase [Gemmatimonadaceae bacterium]